MQRVALFYAAMRYLLLLGGLLASVVRVQGQIQVDLKLPRLQFIAYEPVVATLHITNLAGRDVELRDGDGQAWFGFEITGNEGQPIAPLRNNAQPPLKIEAGKRVTQKINLTPLYPVHDLGTYHVRAHIYFGDLGRFFYSAAKVFEVTTARPIWQKTVGIPEASPATGNVRTYSLLSNRFSDHTSLYVRVEDRDTGVVYATYSLGRIIAFDEPHAEIDLRNELHVLHCGSPRNWTYSHIGLNGELLSKSSFIETKTRPRLTHNPDGAVAVRGGMAETPVPPAARVPVPKLSDRPAEMPKEN